MLKIKFNLHVFYAVFGVPYNFESTLPRRYKYHFGWEFGLLPFSLLFSFRKINTYADTSKHTSQPRARLPHSMTVSMLYFRY